MGFTVWIDGDGTPRDAKEIVFRASDRTKVRVVLVANRPQKVPRSPLISTVLVAGGFDVADEHIAERCEAGDLVVTGDIPLAAQVVEKGAFALQPRGELLDASNVRQRLAVRDLMEEMRHGGLVEGSGPPPYGRGDRERFANALDRFLTRRR